MQTLEITDEQYAFIQRLRREISEEVVGKYGFVRERDALQFLIDNLDGDLEMDIEVDEALHSSATDDVAGSVDAAIAGEPEPASSGEEVSYDESVEPESEPDDSGADVDGSDEDGDDGETNADSGGADGGGDGNADADDDDMLDEMMSLLETHDDKWEESSSSDYRYTVTLPDGSTEDVQTKDDVRALLFKNYR